MDTKFDLTKTLLIGGLLYFLFQNKGSLFSANSSSYGGGFSTKPNNNSNNSNNSGSNNSGSNTNTSTTSDTDSATPNTDSDVDNPYNEKPDLKISGYMQIGDTFSSESNAVPELIIKNTGKRSYIIRGAKASYFINGTPIEFKEHNETTKHKGVALMDGNVKIGPGQEISFDFGHMNCYFGKQRQFIDDMAKVVDGKKEAFKKTYHVLELNPGAARVDAIIYVESGLGTGLSAEDCPSFSYDSKDVTIKYMHDFFYEGSTK